MSDANAWQPWLTAPKDGQVIVVATENEFASINAYVCYWGEEWGWAFIDGNAALGAGGDGPEGEMIIGWAPFPAGDTLLDIAIQKEDERERLRERFIASTADTLPPALPVPSYNTSSG